jgi:hypothetical protein
MRVACILVLACVAPFGRPSLLDELDIIDKIDKKKDAVTVALVRARKMKYEAHEAFKKVRKEASHAGWEDVKDQPIQSQLTAASKKESMHKLKKLLKGQKKMQKILIARQNEAQLELEDLMNASTGMSLEQYF